MKIESIVIKCLIMKKRRDRYLDPSVYGSLSPFSPFVMHIVFNNLYSQGKIKFDESGGQPDNLLTVQQYRHSGVLKVYYKK